MPRRATLISPAGGWRRLGICLVAIAAGLAWPAAAAEPAAVADKIEPGLASELAARGADARVRVIYLLRDRGLPSGRGERGAGAGLGGLRRAVAAQQDGVVTRLRAGGQRVVYASSLTGVIVAEADAAGVAAAAADPEVQAVHRERVRRPRLKVSRVVTQAAEVQARGFAGAGVKVGIVEPGRIGAHVALPPGRRILCRPGVAFGVSDHKTEVAGVVQSTDPTNTGMAPNVTLIDGNGEDFRDAEMIAATDCVVARGAAVVNMSFGLDTDGAWDAFAEYVDRLVYATGVTVVVAVSNDCTQRMGSPEIAYNDLSVGAFADRGTTALADDVQACDPAISPRFSAYRDPPSLHGDREQPDILAPGHLIRTTVTPFGFEEISGTSLAAPHVAGEVALLQDRAPFSLAHQAERVRAIVAASARHDVAGKPRLSDRDGAGAVRFAAADAILRDDRSWWFTTAGGRAGFPRFESFRAEAGQTVRVALAWAQKPGADHRTVATNLQLRVLDPDGRPVRQSSTRDNNLELVAFVASRAGRYRIQVDNVRASAGREHVGLAVSLTDR